MMTASSGDAKFFVSTSKGRKDFFESECILKSILSKEKLLNGVKNLEGLIKTNKLMF